MRKLRQQRVRAEQSACHKDVTKPANGIYVDGVFVKPGEALPDIPLPRSLRFMEKCVVLDDRVVIVMPYTRMAFHWLLAQMERWGEQAHSDDERDRVMELLKASERHCGRWQPR